jgi:hypothetical protein
MSPSVSGGEYWAVTQYSPSRMDSVVLGDHLLFSIKDQHKNIEQPPNTPSRN